MSAESASFEPATLPSPFVPPERQYRLTVDGLEIAVCEWGAADAPPLLLLHGWLDNAGSFFSLAPLLAAGQGGQPYRCIAIDFLGHGASDHLPAGAQYHFIDGVYTVHALLKQLEIERLPVLGHSMGGALALLFAGAFPEAVSHLISVEAFGPLTRVESDGPARLREGCEERLARQSSRKAVYPTVADALRVRAAVGDVPAPLLAPIVERNLMPVPGGVTWCSDARLRWPTLLRMSPAQVSAFFGALRAPMLLAQGDRGMAQITPAVAAHARVLPRFVHHLLAGGHHVHLEQPHFLVEAIGEFLTAR
ncbi:alpha/beta fold hydrolase [Permianibacter sp. IMCC34836]|uniref:alpha/beta fold hydrolase n=1 Tax=Permianibacter fluminis TaxID=2738515 RepID=UPI001552473F|nr:alpha/beta hydrolase [Permianibacter fluminis]NQD38840.1 alpha/beta fold hydrolase [Permianibacter fluminis]